MLLLFHLQSGVSLIDVAVGEEEHLMLSCSIRRQANADVHNSGWIRREERDHFFAHGGSPSSSNSAHWKKEQLLNCVRQ